MWCGGGGFKGTRGTGFLVHRKWSVRQHKVISERLSHVDIGSNVSTEALRLIAVYMPHSGYADEHVEEIYQELDHILALSKQQGISFCITGDFKAQVGPKDYHDSTRTIGPYAFGTRNDRGDMLTRWCSLHDLVIANTHFEATLDELWTYVNADLKLQLDYILLPKSLLFRVLDCRVMEIIDMGSDHRALQLLLAVSQARGTQATNKRVTWRSVDVPLYISSLRSCLQS